MNNLTTIDVVLMVVAAIVVSATLAVFIISPILAKRREKQRQQEERYLEARTLARDFINAQLDYNRSLHAIDNATIEAFEAIIAEIAKHRNG